MSIKSIDILKTLAETAQINAEITENESQGLCVNVDGADEVRCSNEFSNFELMSRDKFLSEVNRFFNGLLSVRHIVDGRGFLMWERKDAHNFLPLSVLIVDKPENGDPEISPAPLSGKTGRAALGIYSSLFAYCSSHEEIPVCSNIVDMLFSNNAWHRVYNRNSYLQLDIALASYALENIETRDVLSGIKEEREDQLASLRASDFIKAFPEFEITGIGEDEPFLPGYPATLVWKRTRKKVPWNHPYAELCAKHFLFDKGFTIQEGDNHSMAIFYGGRMVMMRTLKKGLLRYVYLDSERNRTVEIGRSWQYPRIELDRARDRLIIDGEVIPFFIRSNLRPIQIDAVYDGVIDALKLMPPKMLKRMIGFNRDAIGSPLDLLYLPPPRAKRTCHKLLGLR